MGSTMTIGGKQSQISRCRESAAVTELKLLDATKDQKYQDVAGCQQLYKARSWLQHQQHLQDTAHQKI